MKKITFTLCFLMSLNIFAGDDRFKNYIEVQRKVALSKLKKKAKKVGDKEKINEDLYCVKDGQKSGFYKDSKKKHSVHERKRKIFTRLVRYFFNSIEINQVESNSENILKLKLRHKRDRYLVEKVFYRVGSIWSQTKVAETYTEGDETFVDIDINEIPFGEYKGYFKFLASKVKKKKKKRKKYRVFFGYGSFNKVETVKAFAKFTIEHDPAWGFLKVDGTTSYSEAGNIVGYTYKTYQEGTLVDTYQSSIPEIYLQFKSQGIFQIELTVEDDSGNFATSERQSVTISNAIPDAKYQISESSETNGHFIVDGSESSDTEGGISFYRVTIYTYSEEEGYVTFADHWSPTAIFSFPIPEVNKEFLVRFRAYDETNQFGESPVRATIKYEGEGIAPKYISHYLVTDANFPNFKYFGAEFSDDGSIVEYRYKVKHEDGEELTLFSDNTVKDNGARLTKKGLWTFEFAAIDNDGLLSDIVRETVDVQWDDSNFIPVYQWHDVAQSDHDPRVFYLHLGFNDEFGEVVDYEISINHDDGTSLQPLGSNGLRELRFTKKGNWQFNVVAIDNDGNRSVPLEFTKEVDWGDFTPVADMSISRSDSSPLLVIVNEIRSTPLNEAQHLIIATHSDGTNVNFSFDALFTSFELPKAGEWVIKYKIIDYIGFSSAYQELTFNAFYQDADGDIIPTDPGEDGKQTIAGIDQDNDGIRDDLENFIFQNNYVGDKKKALYQFVRNAQSLILNSNDKSLSIENVKKQIANRYCLESKLGEADSKNFSKKLKVKLYNTKDRLLAWADTESHFAGQFIVPDSAKEGYGQYCEF